MVLLSKNCEYNLCENRLQNPILGLGLLGGGWNAIKSNDAKAIFFFHSDQVKVLKQVIYNLEICYTCILWDIVGIDLKDSWPHNIFTFNFVETMWGAGNSLSIMPALWIAETLNQHCSLNKTLQRCLTALTTGVCLDSQHVHSRVTVTKKGAWSFTTCWKANGPLWKINRLFSRVFTHFFSVFSRTVND